MRTIKRIFVHCSAGSQKQTIDDLKAEFRRKGWKSPGYHYVITTDGGTHQLLAIEEVSNGVQGYKLYSYQCGLYGRHRCQWQAY